MFHKINYLVIGEICRQAESILQSGGAKRTVYMTDEVTHCFMDELKMDIYMEAKDLYSFPILKSLWITESVLCGELLPTSIFSFDHHKILFQNMVFYSKNVSINDKALLWYMINDCGGELVSKVDSSVTHLVTTKYKESLCEAATKDGVHVVTPDWVIDSIVRLQLEPVSDYHPSLLIPPKDNEEQVVDCEIANDILDKSDDEEGISGLIDEKGQSINKRLHVSAQKIKEDFISSVDEDVSPIKQTSSVNDVRKIYEESSPHRIKVKVKNVSTDAYILHNVSKAALTDSARKRNSVVKMPVKMPPIPRIVFSGVPNSDSTKNSSVKIYNVSERPVLDKNIDKSMNAGMAKLSCDAANNDKKDLDKVSNAKIHIDTSDVTPVTKINQSTASLNNEVIPSSLETQLKSTMFLELKRPPINSSHCQQDEIHQILTESKSDTPTISSALNSINSPSKVIPCISNSPVKAVLTMPNSSLKSISSMSSYPAHNHQVPSSALSFYQNRPQAAITALSPIAAASAMHAQPNTPNAAGKASYSANNSQFMSNTNMLNAQNHAMTASSIAQNASIYGNMSIPGNNANAVNMNSLSMVQSMEQKSFSRMLDYSENIPEEACLLGCVFYITDYQKQVPAAELEVWRTVICQMGGQVDDSYSNRITHVLCEHQKSDVFNLALRDGKRLVTAFWLNDCILAKKISPPSSILHLPYIFGTIKLCPDQMICVSNFNGDQRLHVKIMIKILGAKYTGCFSRANTILISNAATGEKYTKACEWRIPVVNIMWLNDLLLGDLNALKMPVASKYTNFTDVIQMPALENSKLGFLFEGWKIPMKISKDAWRKFQSTQHSRTMFNQNPFYVTPSKDTTKEPSKEPSREPTKRIAEEMEPIQDEKKTRLEDVSNYRVLITGVPKINAEFLSQEVERLGGKVVINGSNCTHLVSPSILRTIKFFSGISIAKFIVKPEWIEQSSQVHRFLDERHFLLHDAEAEQSLNIRFNEVLQRADRQKLFQGMFFYLTPSIHPSRIQLSEIIQNAGGQLVKQMPTSSLIYKSINSKGEPQMIIIVCDEDRYLCQSLINRLEVNMPVLHTVEFILTGVLRQEINYKEHAMH